eukprot:CAMPEP_0201593462 /NCGR_PEP_ID=MMETSP0190_2-20130828/191056_1 /ASSEMBLY_ACC=CAM_ASM_000263 /TAXON_ID=37353 /ORGANISM="Rosalina sp." /LENGTH=306 /DNA_ID=CAMNT_0048052653 /DNA_START=1 /DNA_END=921 /DNA_ORIENTATION=-
MELKQIENELEFFNQTYGWNTEYIVNTSSQPKMNTLSQPNTSIDSLISPNNAEMHEDDIKKEPTPIKKARTKDEINEELKTLRVDIIAKETEKEDIQKRINEAVANEQYEVAGQLAPAKKKLVTDVNALKSKVEKLEEELQNVIEAEETESQTQTQETEEQKNEESNTITDDNNNALDSMLLSTKTDDNSTGYNGISTIPTTDDTNNNKGNDEQLFADMVASTSTSTTQQNGGGDDNDNNEENKDKEQESNDQPEVTDDINNDTVIDKINDNNDKQEEDDGGDDDGGDMFANMDTVDGDDDTVNID